MRTQGDEQVSVLPDMIAPWLAVWRGWSHTRRPMKRLLLTVLLCAGCAHVDTTSGTFSQRSGAPMVLTLERHMDTILRGPDIEEDQTLVLELRRIEIGRRLTIPSDDATARFSVKRFGPSSTGSSYKGYVIVRAVTKREVVATLKLEVTATTSDGSYTQTATFHGDYSFVRE
jgi:hypothetical protein